MIKGLDRHKCGGNRMPKAFGYGMSLRMRRSLSLVLIVFLINGTFFGIVSIFGDSEPTPGPEFQVNTYTTNWQRYPSVAMDSNGNFIIAWESTQQDGDSSGIFAQRYNSFGIPQGSEFQVNTYTTDGQRLPSVAMDSNGNFVITWTSWGQDGYEYGVFAQRYSSVGVPQGSEFQVNTYTNGTQDSSSVAMDSSGNFIIAWRSDSQDGDSSGIFAQRYNSVGVPQSSEFQVNTYTTGGQFDPSVAIDSNGNFVIAWTSDGQDGDLWGIFAQRYNSTGVPQGSEFQVNTFTTEFQFDQSIAMDSDGNFVITWTSNIQDGGTEGIFAQRYNSTGVPQGSEFQVNTYITDGQRYSSAAMDSSGNFVITWTSWGQDGDSEGIFAQRYDNTGIPQGFEFQVNNYTTSWQSHPSAAMDSKGNFVIAWESLEQDGDNFGIYARLYSNEPPEISNVLLDDGVSQANTLVVEKSQMMVVYLNATIDDSCTGNSNISYANYTIGKENWSSSRPLDPIDGAFDEPIENVTVSINISSWLMGTYQLWVYASDALGNKNITGLNAILIIQDTTPPTITDVLTVPDPQEVFGTVNLSANVADNYQPFGAWVEIYDPEGNFVGNFSMLYDQINDRYYWNQTYDVLGAYTFTIWANDTSDNWGSTSESFTTQDTTPPTITDIAAVPDPQEVFGAVNISTSVTDNYQPFGAWVEVYDPEGNFVGNLSMLYDQINDRYYWNQTYDVLGAYTFTIWANDTSDNWESASDIFGIQDIAKPQSEVDELPTYTTTTTFIITAIASDVSGVQKVELWYKRNTDDWMLFGTDTVAPWSWDFDSSTSGGDGTYQFYSRAYDIPSNYEDAPMGNDTWTIIDTQKPVIIETIPADGAKNVKLTSNITIIFSETMDTKSVEDAFGFSDGEITWRIIDGEVTWASTYHHNDSLVFDPHEDFNTGMNYIVTIGSTAKDLAGNTLSIGEKPNPWSFTTPFPTPSPKKENWKPLIALIFAIILLIAGSIVAKNKPLISKIKKLSNEMFTFFTVVLPFIIAEIIAGIISWFTGALRVPSWLGIGMFVDLAILAVGLLVYFIVYKKGISKK